jgi:hypothetical protein
VPQVTLTGTDVHKERNCGLAADYTVYIMRVLNGSQSWVCEKRYSDFACLDEVMHTASSPLPSLVEMHHVPVHVLSRQARRTFAWMCRATVKYRVAMRARVHMPCRSIFLTWHGAAVPCGRGWGKSRLWGLEVDCDCDKHALRSESPDLTPWTGLDGVENLGNLEALNKRWCFLQVLRSKFWYMSVPKLPAKKLFFNFDKDFVEK